MYTFFLSNQTLSCKYVFLIWLKFILLVLQNAAIIASIEMIDPGDCRSFLFSKWL